MLDDKQERLINAWMTLADGKNTNPYTRFISLSIAFNAYCYAHYYHLAERHRADLGNDNGLNIFGDQAPTRQDSLATTTTSGCRSTSSRSTNSSRTLRNATPSSSRSSASPSSGYALERTNIRKKLASGVLRSHSPKMQDWKSLNDCFLRRMVFPEAYTSARRFSSIRKTDAN